LLIEKNKKQETRGKRQETRLHCNYPINRTFFVL